MTQNTRRDLLGLGAGLLVWQSAFSQSSDAVGDLAGSWTGTLLAGSQRLRLRLVINPDGKAALFSLDQGSDEIPARCVPQSAARVRIEVKSINGAFNGQRVGADRIEGIWNQGGDLPLVLLRGDAGLVASAIGYEPLTAEALEKLRDGAHAPALAAARLKVDERQHWQTGKRAVIGASQVQAGDLWHLGSITKSMTATLVGGLVDAGMITFDDTVEQHLGEVAPAMQSAYRGVTFRHLLSHRAGLPGDLPMMKFMGYLVRGSVNLREQRRDWARAALEMPPLGVKEKHFAYANNGYIVAGAMLEAAFDRLWEDLMREHLFRPLKLASAGFGAPRGAQPLGHEEESTTKLLANLVRSKVSVLKPVPDFAAKADNPPALGPAGTVHMSLDDVLSYLAAHRDRSAFLKPETWRTLHTPPYGGDYAMGWTVRADGCLWHNGSNTKWYAEVMVDAAKRTCAVAATNEARIPAQQAVGTALMRALA